MNEEKDSINVPVNDVNTELNDLLHNPFATIEAQSPSSETPKTKNVGQEDSKILDNLPLERQKQAKELATQINVGDAQSVMRYGVEAQQKLGEFSHTMLNHVQNQDTGEIGQSLNNLMFRLNEAKPNELQGKENNVFKKMFGKARHSMFEMTAKYQKIGAQIDKIAFKLDKEKDILLSDNTVLEQLYDKNKDYFNALNLYIAAGEIKLEELQQTLIPEANQIAISSGNQMDVQMVNDLNQFAERLDKRTHDLRLARQMTIQQAPQIRLIQNTNQALAEKIQSSIHTAIPLWKNQIAIALTLIRQKDAVIAQKQVSETTNDLMKKNSEMLKTSAIETAIENERGIIDIETLQKTQTDLIETLQETLKIQEEGRNKRKAAEIELTVMESDLRDKLLELTEKN